MSWQEILLDVVPVVVSFVSAIVLFCRTGQKKYIDRFASVLRQTYPAENSFSESYVTIKSDTSELVFKPSDYGLTADEVLTAFRAFLESAKNGNDK